MVPGPEVAIVDLTVDDLKDEEIKIDTTLGRMVSRLSDPKVMKKMSPVQDSGSSKTRIKFSKPSDEWKDTKTWKFIQIQLLVNLLTSVYKLKVNGMTSIKAATKEKHAIAAAEACDFFQEGQVKTKADMDAHVSRWLSPLLAPSFCPHMAALCCLLAPPCVPPAPKDAKLRYNYKCAKSALENHRFAPPAEARLRRIVTEFVQLEA